MHYERRHLPGDLLAGVIVATLLIPQAMAYAILAGLPPQVGLYASLLPLAVYALLGSSRVLSVGPSALLSLLILTEVAAWAEPGSPRFLAFAMATALLVGVMQMAMGFARLGVLTNFLSQPVLSGFTSAAACLIALSQVPSLLGISLPPTRRPHGALVEWVRAMPEVHGPTAVISLASVLLLLAFRVLPPRVFAKRKSPVSALTQSLSKIGPLAVVILGTLFAATFQLGERNGVEIIGEIQGGLPGFTFPSLAASEFLPLVPLAFTISFIGFLENITIGKSLAAKRRQKIDSNQEFIALGAANLAAGVTGGYPVSGSFARSTVNFAAGAHTGLASLITVALMGVATLFLMPLFHHLPRAVLAAIILVAITGLMDFRMPCRLWRYNKADAAALILTFVSVLVLGITKGILIGVASTIVLHLWRTSRPHMAVAGRVPGTGHFVNVLHYKVQTLPHVLMLRIDESLYFANSKYVEDYVLSAVAERPRLRHFVLICTAVNFVDASALETLIDLRARLRDAGIKLYLTEVKKPLMDRLADTEFMKTLGPKRVFFSTVEAYEHLADPSLHEAANYTESST